MINLKNSHYKNIIFINDKIHETGRKYEEGYKESMKLIFDKEMPKWNFRVVTET
jgi:hypothetical protein